MILSNASILYGHSLHCKHGVLRLNVVTIDVDILLIWHVELLPLVGQDCDV